jgi:Predicted HD superfamily hydrolase
MARMTKERDYMDNHGISSEWLGKYINGFRGEDGTLHPLLEVKRVHSMKVRDNCALIADGLGWTGSRRDLALTAAVLHDAGRFLQFATYGPSSTAPRWTTGTWGTGCFRSLFPGSGLRERV